MVDAMMITIDKAGRPVIPAATRDRLGLTPGTTLEMSVDESGLRLERVAAGPQVAARVSRLTGRCGSTAPGRGLGANGGRLYDAHIAEVARAAGARVIVTDNRRHFLTALRHGPRGETPTEFMHGEKRRR
jgi:AbrB family looped-hinge helix DNA binding protein